MSASIMKNFKKIYYLLCDMYSMSHNKHAVLFLIFISSITWSIFILFVPVEIEMNTVQRS